MNVIMQKPAMDMAHEMNHNKKQHGDNPSMGMEGHNHHAMMIADFKKRFYLVLILTVPIMLLSAMIQKFMGVDWQFTGSKYILLGLSSVVFFYGGWPFFKGLVTEIKTKTPGMMFLIGFAITAAYIYSVAVVFGLKGEDFFLGTGNTNPHHAFGTLDRNEIYCRGIKRIRVTGSVDAPAIDFISIQCPKSMMRIS